MARLGYSTEHDAFRHTVRTFLDREHEPNLARYEREGGLGADFWHKAGEAGLLGLAHTGERDFTFYAIMAEELGRTVGSATTGSSLMADVATYILIGHGTRAQQDAYLPGILTGDWRQAMPLTEPGAGSDPTAITTTALRDGDDYVINGDKYFISNGSGANLLYVVAEDRSGAARQRHERHHCRGRYARGEPGKDPDGRLANGRYRGAGL